MSPSKKKTGRRRRIAVGRPLPQVKGPEAKSPSTKVPKTRGPSTKFSKTDRPVQVIEPKDLAALRTEVATLAEKGQPAPRWNADPQDVQRSVVRLVLALVEFIRKLLERQAIRRMDAGTLSPEETERVGLALMRLEETIHDMAKDFGINPEDLNLDLGPIGKLM